MAMPNAGGNKFPKSLGYCGVGRVMQIGSEVTNISVGDRVLVYHGKHMKYNVTPESDVTKVENDAISSLDAAFVPVFRIARIFITSFVMIPPFLWERCLIGEI